MTMYQAVTSKENHHHRHHLVYVFTCPFLRVHFEFRSSPGATQKTVPRRSAPNISSIALSQTRHNSVSPGQAQETTGKASPIFFRSIFLVGPLYLNCSSPKTSSSFHLLPLPIEPDFTSPIAHHVCRFQNPAPRFLRLCAKRKSTIPYTLLSFLLFLIAEQRLVPKRPARSIYSIILKVMFLRALS